MSSAPVGVVGAALSLAGSGNGTSCAAAAVASGVVVEFALSDCSEFVMSGDVLVASGSRILEGEGGTDIGVAAAAVWLN